jgi:2-polyprenyl-3-methyl-5-hydroxy-6-metoxy-1,4-benzoquinol methylase
VSGERLAAWAAELLMRMFPAAPTRGRIDLAEVFCMAEYRCGTPDDRRRLQLQSAEYRYQYESELCFLEKYFPQVPQDQLRGKRVLDLGCFTGGRLVHWTERYGFATATGIDIEPVYAQAGRRFARARGIQANFATCHGEALPFESGSFDLILSFDVLEHVQDIERVMAECARVLAPGGRLMTAFPPFYQAVGSHLGMFTTLPALHWLFDGETLARAIYHVGRKRGQDAKWYARRSPALEAWERAPYLNGITVTRFRRILRRQGWRVVHWSQRPILTDGRRADIPIFRALSLLFVLPARLPVLEELFLGRICCVLERDAPGDGCGGAPPATG